MEGSNFMASQLLEQVSRYRYLVYKAVVEHSQYNGASRQKIEKYIHQTESCQDRHVNTDHVRLALRDALNTGVVVRVKGYGLNGSFAPAIGMDERFVDYEIHHSEHVMVQSQQNKTYAVAEVAGNLEQITATSAEKGIIQPQDITASGSSLKTILKTPTRRFPVKRARCHQSAPRVKFARSPKVVFISPSKHRRSTRLVGSCVERR